MAEQHDDANDARLCQIGSLRLFLRRDGRVWREGSDGKPTGAPIPWQSLRQAQAIAKRDPSLRQATTDPRRFDERGKPKVLKQPSLPLVFDEDGVRMVRFVCGMPKQTMVPSGRMMPDPIPLRGDESEGWVVVFDARDGRLCFHAPSLAYQQFANTRND